MRLGSTNVPSMRVAWTLLNALTVADDTSVDQLFGNNGFDWFILNHAGSGALDTFDGAPNEIATDLPLPAPAASAGSAVATALAMPSSSSTPEPHVPIWQVTRVEIADARPPSARLADDAANIVAQARAGGDSTDSISVDLTLDDDSLGSLVDGLTADGILRRRAL